MLQTMLAKCQQKYPQLTYYMEANLSSAMPIVARKAGFEIPNIAGVPQVARANVKVKGFKSDENNNTYNNFVLMVYPAN
jgi:hypothetical protein